jgi:protein-tyrosine phosphatase
MDSSAVQTSASSPIRIAWIFQTGAAGFGVTLAPGKRAVGVAGVWNRDLHLDLLRLGALGAAVLAPLLPDEELSRLGIGALPEEAERHGLRVHRYQFPDGGVPAELADFDLFLERLSGELVSGRSVVAHCRGGLGRAGLTAACMLLRHGRCATSAEAITEVRAKRSPQAVETAAQEAFVASYSAWLQGAVCPSSRR